MKKLVALLACICLINFTAACTSKDSKEEEVTTEESVAEEGADAVAEDGASGNTDETQAGFVDEPLPDQAMGETPAAEQPTDQPVDAGLETPPSETTPAEGFATSEEPTPTPGESTDVFAPSDDTTNAAGVDPGGAPIVDTPPPETTPTEAVPAPEAAPAEVKPPVALKKIETVPFKRGGQLLNAVYIARPGDSYKSISTMIYGSAERQKDIKKANPSIKSPKPGDKIYYNSPMRTTDDTKVLTYYEEMGIAPEYYEAKEGDDFRKTSKELLGYPNAWKEVFSLNEGVESTRGKLPAGTKLRYWKAPPTVATEAPAKAEEVAAIPPPPPEQSAPPPPANELPPPPPADIPPPPPAQAALNELPPPPPPADIPPPPPVNELPPPPADIPPPPPPEQAAPPPPPVAKKKAVQAEGMDNDTTMALAAGAIIAAGVAGLILVRKRRQKKEMEAAFNETQVG